MVFRCHLDVAFVIISKLKREIEHLLIIGFSAQQFGDVLFLSALCMNLRRIFIREIHLDDNLPNPKEDLLSGKKTV